MLTHRCGQCDKSSVQRVRSRSIFRYGFHFGLIFLVTTRVRFVNWTFSFLKIKPSSIGRKSFTTHNFPSGSSVYLILLFINLSIEIKHTRFMKEIKFTDQSQNGWNQYANSFTLCVFHLFGLCISPCLCASVVKNLNHGGTENMEDANVWNYFSVPLCLRGNKFEPRRHREHGG